MKKTIVIVLSLFFVFAFTSASFATQKAAPVKIEEKSAVSAKVNKKKAIHKAVKKTTKKKATHKTAKKATKKKAVSSKT